MRSCRSLRSTLAAAAAVSLAVAGGALAQERTIQQLFEAGQYEEVLARVAGERAAGSERLESAFLAAQAARRLERADRVVEEYERLAATDNPAWAAIGRSGVALQRELLPEALAAAAEAVRLQGSLGYAHYQLGLVHARLSSHEAAAQAFARAAEAMPAFAYAHYYAGLSFQRVKNLNRAATHFERFLQLAPEAPERTAVLAIMRSIRG